jgi:ABC-2 type transport system permease protein
VSGLGSGMKKTVHVLVYEIISLISRFSFWFAAVGVPLIAFVIFSVFAGINSRNGANQSVSSVVSEFLAEPETTQPDGYVDLSGVIQQLPSGTNSVQLLAYHDEQVARSALDAHQIRGYYVIPPDYVQTGEITYITSNINPSAIDNSNQIEYVLNYNLLDENAALLNLAQAPMNLQDISLSNEPVRNQNNALTFFLPYTVTLLFYFMIMGTSTLLLNSISKEKENRVIEILMVSMTPGQLLTGKMIGLGIVGLFEILIWGGTGYVLLRLSGQNFSLPPEFQLPLSILAWGVVFFILGYLLYACLMSGLGALVPNLREASQTTFIVALPLLIPLLLISILIEDPNGWLAIILSMIPLTSPVTMMLRLAATTVPVWQLLLSIGLLVVAVILAIRAAAGMFRAQTLLSGQSFNLRKYLLALAGHG